MATIRTSKATVSTVDDMDAWPLQAWRKEGERKTVFGMRGIIMVISCFRHFVL